MVDVQIIHQTSFSDYPIKSSSLGKRLREFLIKRGQENVSVLVVIATVDEMKRLGKIYLKEKDNQVHNVLSFPEAEVSGKFISPKTKLKKLGEVIVCFEKAKEEAVSEAVTIDEKICELAEHGVRHLLGEHHD